MEGLPSPCARTPSEKQMDNPALKIDRLTKRFGKVEAVRDLSLTVSRGETYAFLGPNGAGKTTTLKVVTGLLQADEGAVEVCGEKVEADALPFRRVMGYVSDRPYLFEKLTAWEHLEFIAQARELKGWEPFAQELFALFHLEDWKFQLIEGFSHGMRQKLAITGSLIHRPKLLLVDEPMVGLDPRSARDLKELLGRMTSEGMGLFLSTHSLDTAAEISDRIGILDNGRMVAEGSFSELRELAEKPESTLEEVFLRLTEEADQV